MLRPLAVMVCLMSVVSAMRGAEVPRETLAVLGLADLEVQEIDVRSSPWQFRSGPDDVLVGYRCELPVREFTLPTLTLVRRRLTYPW